MVPTTVAPASSRLLLATAPLHLLPVCLPPSPRLLAWLLLPPVLLLQLRRLLLAVLRVPLDLWGP